MIFNPFTTMITRIVTLIQNTIVQPTKLSPISTFPSTLSSAGSCQIVPPLTRQRLPPTDKSKPASLLPIRTPTELEGLLSSIQASLTLDSPSHLPRLGHLTLFSLLFFRIYYPLSHPPSVVYYAQDCILQSKLGD